jgi:hypothetical protein
MLRVGEGLSGTSPAVARGDGGDDLSSDDNEFLCKRNPK